jgi:SAM-dependent methyltransferase
VILFEAIYYLPSAERFVAGCRRVLRPGGKVLIATANKDLYDFNPSPHSFTYYGVSELNDLFRRYGFASSFFGNTPVEGLSWRQRMLRPVKKFVANSGLMPKTMAGKKILKRLVFGSLVPMPAEIVAGMVPYVDPVPIPADRPDRKHKVLYCVGTRPG